VPAQLKVVTWQADMQREINSRPWARNAKIRCAIRQLFCTLAAVRRKVQHPHVRQKCTCYKFVLQIAEPIADQWSKIPFYEKELNSESLISATNRCSDGFVQSKEPTCILFLKSILILNVPQSREKAQGLHE
jgi:hypothetical protein